MNLWRRWLGPDRSQWSLYTEQALASAFFLQAGAVGGAVAAWVGAPTAAWLGFALIEFACALGFPLLVRSGWSRRFAEPMMLGAQATVAILCASSLYLMLDRFRGLVIGPVVLVMAFSMFRLGRQGTWRLMAFTLACFALASFTGWRLWPQRFEGATELLHLVVLLICIPGIGLLSLQMSAVRDRLVRQQARLQQAMEEIERLAHQDALTGLPNRRHGEEALKVALERLRRQGVPLVVALVDLDHFKQVNDRHGHATGDTVLQRFAQLGRDTLRRTDLMARWGGEEFLLLLDGQDPDLGLTRLQAAVRANTEPLPFRFSAGCVVAQPDDAPEALLERADAALYRAKELGRDRCEWAG